MTVFAERGKLLMIRADGGQRQRAFFPAKKGKNNRSGERNVKGVA